MNPPLPRRDGPAVEMSGIRRSFGGRQVLGGISASLGRGRVVGLLGRNGEGKTTLLRVLLDMLVADSGECRVLGMRPDGSGRIRAHVGYVPERPAFHPFMSIGEVLSLRAALFPSWDAGRAEALCGRLGLDPASPVRGASKGTLGKLAWICAAAHAPSLFFLDEPTSGLDALVREDLLDNLVGELHGAGKTFLITNHRMEEFAGLLDEVWVLSDGVLRGIHSIEELRKARRVVGRLRDGARLPEGLELLDLRLEGRRVECSVLDEAIVRTLGESGALEGLDASPLGVEGAFKLLLRGKP